MVTAPIWQSQPDQALRMAVDAPARRFATMLDTLLGTVMLLAQLGSTLGQINPVLITLSATALLVLRRAEMREQGLKFVWIGSFAIFALCSTLWSATPGLTFYYASQLMLTVMCAYALWITFDLRGFLRVCFLASVLVCVASLASGITGPSKTGPVLIGITGSKNAMASAANLMLVTGGALLFDRHQTAGWRWASLPCIALSLYLIATTHAATTIILSILAIPAALGFWMLNRMSVQWRLPLLAFLALLMTPVAIYYDTITNYAEDYVFTTFDKDRTLTGRTYLWTVAREQIAERPIAGWGYRSLWMSYSSAAIGMLRSQGVTDPRTFSMHQSYLETRTDTGILGMLLFAATLMVGTFAACIRAVYRGTTVNIFLAIYLVGLLIRTWGETLPIPFYVYYTLLLVMVGYAVYGSERRQEPALAHGQPA